MIQFLVESMTESWIRSRFQLFYIESALSISVTFSSRTAIPSASFIIPGIHQIVSSYFDSKLYLVFLQQFSASNSLMFGARIVTVLKQKTQDRQIADV